MKIVYECEHCRAQFNDATKCRCHEILHLNGVEELKYRLRYFENKELCPYCDHVYYVYGTELNCAYENSCCDTNNYKEFVPIKELNTKGEYRP